jgi:hypothetical protein
LLSALSDHSKFSAGLKEKMVVSNLNKSQQQQQFLQFGKSPIRVTVELNKMKKPTIVTGGKLS